MTILCVILTLLLATSILLHWQSAKRSQDQWQKLAIELGLKFSSPEAIAEHATSIRLAADLLPRERTRHQLFESLLNEIRQGLVIVDADLRIRFANQTMAVLLHRSAIQIGRTLLEELRDHQLTDIVVQAIRDKTRLVRTIQMLAADGANLSGRHFIIEASPLPSPGEGGAWLMLQDITEATLTEQIRKDFIANASHELRTPLTIINGYIEALQDGVVTAGPGLKRCLDTMEKHGKRIARTIEDMLAISKLEDSTAVLNCEPFDVRQCVQDAIDHLTSYTEGRDTRIELDFPAQAPHLVGDRFYWDQIFTNLIENALKENPAPGLIIRIVGKWTATHCILAVSDNGTGISAHDLPFIFKRFFRGDKHHSSTIKGTGLGLSIVKRAVKAHGGTITATSRPGQETAFTMKVPVKFDGCCK